MGRFCYCSLMVCLLGCATSNDMSAGDASPLPDASDPPDAAGRADAGGAPMCGDDVCSGGEDCTTCVLDCGACIDPVSCETTPLSTVGTEYFVATTGDDDDPGTMQSPFRSIRKGLSALTPGDTLTIREGLYRVMEEPSYDVGIDDGTETAYVTIRGYPGERVRIYGSLSTEGRSWESYDANIWRTPAGFLENDPKAMFHGDRRVTHQSDLDGGRDHDNVSNLVDPDHWTKADADGNQCFGDNEGCFIYFYPPAGEDPNDEVYELSQRGLGRFWSDHLVVRGLEIYYAQPQPIFFEGADDIVVEGNVFGHTSNGNDNSYGMRIWSSGGALVRYNVVFDSVYWGGVSNSKGITFMVSDPDNPHVVEYNEVFDIPGQAAIGVKSGVSNLIARYNYIHDVNTAFEPGGYRCVWSATNTDGCQPTDAEYRPGGHWRIYGNVVVNARVGVRLPGSAEDSDDNWVFNNDFYGGGVGIRLGFDGPTGHRFFNNIFAGLDAGFYLHSGGTTTTVDDYVGHYSSFNNLFFDNTQADIHLRPNWTGGEYSGTPYTLPEFRSEFDEESSSISADPDFVGAPADLHLSATSPAVGAGVGEFFGVASVDIGAYPLGEWACPRR